jgi:hypothetical protein
MAAAEIGAAAIGYWESRGFEAAIRGPVVTGVNRNQRH